MDLQEEYFKRHNLDMRRFYRYVSYNNLLLVKPDEEIVSKRYIIFNIRGTNREGDAGRFDFTTFMPVHNGYKSRSVLTPHFDERSDKCYWCACADDKGLEWEGYEEKLDSRMAYFRKHKFQALADPHEIVLACWDMMLFTYDSCITEMTETLVDRVYQTIDGNMSKEAAYNKVGETIKLLNELGQTESNVSLQCRHLLQGWQLLKEYIEPKNYGWWLLRFFQK